MKNKNNQYLQRLKRAMTRENKQSTNIYKPNFIERAWDGAIGLFSPATALRNSQLRRALKRSYAGAKKTPSLSQYWDGLGGDANASIRRDRQTVANRVRQLTRDMPWMDGAVEATADYWVGEGFNFKPAVTESDGQMDRETNRIIKDAFVRWCEKASADDRDHFGDLQRLAVRQIVETGEAVFLHRYYKDGYRLLSLESDCISNAVGSVSKNIDQGIKFDPERNRNIEYYFNTPGSAMRDVKTIKAENVLHIFKRKRPWQRRGISPLVQTILIAADLDEFLSGEMSAQQMASRWLAFVTDPNSDTMGEISDQEIHTVLDNLTIETLPPGKSIQLASGAERPTLGLETFQKIFLQILSVILRIPYSVISADFKELNYNTLREIRNNTVHRLKSEWRYLERHFLNPVYRNWMDYAVLSGELKLKNYFMPGGKWNYQKCFWLPPGIESVDVLRDIKGVLLASKNGMFDPNDWIMSQGEDPEEIMAGIAEFQRMLEEYGIVLEKETSDTNLRSVIK